MIKLPFIMLRKCRRIAPSILAAFSAIFILVQGPAAAGGADRSGDRFAFVLLAAGNSSSTMNASTADIRRATTLRAGREGLLYVRQGGAAYVIRDAATLREAEAIFRPQQELGARQAELGAQQAALGQRQARLGAEQARLGLRRASASPRRAEELGRQQDALGRQQGALGREQNALGRQQDALGREQSRLAGLADAKIRALLAEALRRGVARRVD